MTTIIRALTEADYGLPAFTAVAITLTAATDDTAPAVLASLLVGGLARHAAPTLSDTPDSLRVLAPHPCHCWGSPAETGDLVATITIDATPEALQHADLLGLAADVLSGVSPTAPVVDQDDQTSAPAEPDDDDEDDADEDDEDAADASPAAPPEPPPKPSRRQRRAPKSSPPADPADDDDLAPAMPGPTPALY